MHKILFFDYSAMIVQFVTLTIIFYRRLTLGLGNKVFSALIIALFLTTFCDVGMEWYSAMAAVSRAHYIAAHIFSYGYFIFRSSNNLFYLIFVLAITRTSFSRSTRRLVYILSTPFIVIVAFILSNLAHGKIFTITVSEGYSRGPWLPALYVLSLGYILIGVIVTLKSIKFLKPDKWIPIFLPYPLALVAVAIQYFWPNYIVEMFAMSVSMLIMMMMVLRPEEIMDSGTGLLNEDAYFDAMKTISATKQGATIVIIRLTNAYQVRSYLGEDRYRSYIVKVAGKLRELCKVAKLKGQIYYGQSGCLYIIFYERKADYETIVPNSIKSFKEEMTDLSDFGVRLNQKICLLHYPEDISDYKSLMHFSSIFPSLMAETDSYSTAAALIKAKDFKLLSNMDKILDRAIKNNNLQMYYQPIYSLKEGKFISAEALIRLKDPQFGFVPPSLFIPAAEKNGLILQIGDFVLRDVYRFISENDLESLGMEYIEINLSVSQCLQRNFPNKIFSLQEEFSVSPAWVNFEITETGYENSREIMESNIKSLSESGYTISLDDYGTGYSNIQRILKIPLSIVKLDKSMVDNMDSEKGRSIVESTIRMMQMINMEIVAEGVETQDTLEMLRQMNGDFIQGYYFSKPLPEHEFIEFLKTKNKIKAS